MDNLIAWTEGQTKEVWHWYRRDKVCKCHKTAYFVYSFWWICGYIEMLLWPNDIDIFSVVHYLAQERYVLEREDGYILLNQIISKHVSCLKIKATLTKDCSNISSVFQVRLDLFKDLYLCVCWWTYQYDLCSRDYILCIFRALSDLALHVSLELPCWFLCVCLDFWCPQFWSSGEHFDRVFRVLMADYSNCTVSEVSTTANR